MSEQLLPRPNPAELTFKDFSLQGEAATVYDDSERYRIRGLSVGRYMLAGLREEFEESVDASGGPATNATGPYNRFDVLARPLHRLGPYQANMQGLKLHRAEFGDLFWYIDRSLAQSETGLDEAAQNYMEGFAPGSYDGTIRSVDTLVWQSGDEFLQAKYPALRGLVKTIRDDTLAVYQMAFKDYADLYERAFFANTLQKEGTSLGSRAMPLLCSMSWIVQRRLGASLACVAADNMVKVAKRKAAGTTFGNGDDDAVRVRRLNV